MRYDEAIKLSDNAFVRLTGATKDIAAQVSAVLEAAEPVKAPALGGYPCSLSVDDKLMTTLEYWREYRTFFHIGASFGVSDSAAHKHISLAEEVLSDERAVGLFGILSGEVYDLAMTGVNIDCGKYRGGAVVNVGAVAGKLAGGTIRNISVGGQISSERHLSRLAGADEYLKRRHIAGEYRAELAELIRLLDDRLPAILKKFRRMYSDAGYFIKDKIKGRDITEAIALGASLPRDYTLIKHIDEEGLLDRYLKG